MAGLMIRMENEKMIHEINLNLFILPVFNELINY